MNARNPLERPSFVLRSIWSRREWLNGIWFYAEVFLWGLIGVAGIYFVINHMIANYGSYVWNPQLSIDRQIPAVAWMIIPYASLYLLTPGAIFIHPRTERGRMELLLALQGVVLLSATHAIFFLLFPADIALRDQLPADILAYEGLYGAIFEVIHSIDNPTNAWPSLHITLSYVLCRVITIWCDRDFSEKFWGQPLKIVLWINWVLLCISILTTKQHFLFDLITGLTLALLWWKLMEPGFERLDEMGGAEFEAATSSNDT